MAMPSETAMVTNSLGVPPASFTPCFTALAWRSRVRLQGVASFQVLATPTQGLWMSSSVSPIDLKNARCGARLGPSVTTGERGRFMISSGRCADPLEPRHFYSDGLSIARRQSLPRHRDRYVHKPYAQPASAAQIPDV